jgi:hypothetical protein
MGHARFRVRINQINQITFIMVNRFMSLSRYSGFRP